MGLVFFFSIFRHPIQLNIYDYICFQDQKRHTLFEQELAAMNKLIFARDEEIEKLRARVRELENSLGKNTKIQVNDYSNHSNLAKENQELKRVLLERDDEIAYLKSHLIKLGHDVMEETLGYRVNSHRGERYLNERIHHSPEHLMSRDFYNRGRRSLDGYQVYYDR
jgi:hypothetical protein